MLVFARVVSQVLLLHSMLQCITLNIGVISKYLTTLTAQEPTNQNEAGHSAEHDPGAPAISSITS